MSRIYIIGFMGAGKSTVGKLLAIKLGFHFIDLDRLIEQRTGLLVSEIFDAFGEKDFRKVEASALFAVSKKENVVISTGGGTSCFYDNMDLILTKGKAVYLYTNAKELSERLAEEQNLRPLIANLPPGELLDYVKSKLNERSAFYERCSYKVDATGKPEDIVNEILNLYSEEDD